jgi:hypothetical protein
MSVTTTEDFQKARQDRDSEASQNSNTDPIPFYIFDGRYFMGLGKSDSILHFRQYAVQQHIPR